MDHSKQHYYGAVPAMGRFRGHIWHYDSTGNRQMQVWLSDEKYNTKEDA